jgi:transposase
MIALGHEVKLIAPQYVKPFVKGNKNDYNDAEAIAEAAQRPTMRFVPIKSVEQQDIQNLHCQRERIKKARTALANQIRGLLAEYAVVINKASLLCAKDCPTSLTYFFAICCHDLVWTGLAHLCISIRHDCYTQNA